MKLARRAMHKVISQERAKILSEMSEDPVHSIATLLNLAGVDFEQTGNEFYVSTGNNQGVSITVERREK